MDFRVPDDLVIAVCDRKFSLRTNDVGIELTALFVVSGGVLLWVVNHLWDRMPAPDV